MVKAVQYHPVTDEIIHLDFMRVRRSEKMTISVPLVLVGKPIGVIEGGILSQALNQIEISCFPTNVPDQIEVNVDKMELNSSISIADVSTDDEEVEILSSSEINIASINSLQNIDLDNSELDINATITSIENDSNLVIIDEIYQPDNITNYVNKISINENSYTKIKINAKKINII